MTEDYTILVLRSNKLIDRRTCYIHIYIHLVSQLSPCRINALNYLPSEDNNNTIYVAIGLPSAVGACTITFQCHREEKKDDKEGEAITETNMASGHVTDNDSTCVVDSHNCHIGCFS